MFWASRSGILMSVSEVVSQSGPVGRWAEWVAELADRRLDQYEYLGLVQHRDSVQQWLEVRGSDLVAAAVDEIDVDFQALTVEAFRP